MNELQQLRLLPIKIYKDADGHINVNYVRLNPPISLIPVVFICHILVDSSQSSYPTL